MTELLNLTGKDLEREIDRIAGKNKSRQRFWTEKEDLILIELHKRNVSVRAIARELGRSYEAVINRGKRLGYSR